MSILKANLPFEQRLDKNVMVILKAAPELSAILAVGDRNIDDDDPSMTACTDGRNEFYGRAYCEDKGDAQVRFIIIHENYHKMTKDMATWAHLWDIDHELANVAMDYRHNFDLWHLYSNKSVYGDLIDWVDGALYNPRYDATWDTAKIFWELYTAKKKGNPPPCMPTNPKTGQPSVIDPDNKGNGQGIPKEFRDKHDF